jgi:hypothetical protein
LLKSLCDGSLATQVSLAFSDAVGSGGEEGDEPALPFMRREEKVKRTMSGYGRDQK